MSFIDVHSEDLYIEPICRELAIALSSYHEHDRRLAEANLVPSVGSVGDSYDNALAETINGLYKTEINSPKRSEPRALAVDGHPGLGDWQNNWRLFAPIGYIPPARQTTIQAETPSI